MKELAPATVLALHALHAMVRKARPVSTQEIHRSSGFALDMVRSVISRLRREGLIRNRSGHGYVLARAPGEISVQMIVEAVDAPRPPAAPCGGDYEACATRASCILAPLCRNAEQGFQQALRSFTLAELTDVPLEVPNCLDPRTKAS